MAVKKRTSAKIASTEVQTKAAKKAKLDDYDPELRGILSEFDREGMPQLPRFLPILSHLHDFYHVLPTVLHVL